nr:polyamine-modulated factor 1 [Tanacetum cinerariifolium]
MEKARKNELNKSFKVAVQGLLTTCSKQEFCKSFPSFTQAEQERLYNQYIQVIISLHENIEEKGLNEIIRAASSFSGVSFLGYF